MSVIRLRRTRCWSECGIFPCRIVLLHLRRSRDYSEKFLFVRNELDTTLKLHTHTGLMEVSCADLKVGRVPKALIPPSVEGSFLLAAWAGNFRNEVKEVSCADLWVGRVPKALTIRQRRIVGRFTLLTLVSKLTSFAM
jgi:hypothetical protein